MDARTNQSIRTGSNNRTIDEIPARAAFMLNQDLRINAGGFTLAALSYESQLENRRASL